ncbi:MAG: hypothetical protein ACE5E6_03260 [Phycisphaerae bacterium]
MFVGVRDGSRFGMLAVAGVLAAQSAVSAQTIGVLDQLRFTQVVAGVGGCDEPVMDEEFAPDTAPFMSEILAEQDCNGEYGAVWAFQNSEINASSLLATGGTFTKINGGGMAGGLVHGNSEFDIVFDLATPSTFSLTGVITVEPTVQVDTLFFVASVTLTGPNGVVVFDAVVDSFDVMASLPFDEQGVLEPGGYSLTVSALTQFDAGETPDIAVGGASFDVTLDVFGNEAGTGDFDGDGDVDLDDFLSFRACYTGKGGGPVGPACAAGDFDLDGDIDLADYVAFRDAFTG